VECFLIIINIQSGESLSAFLLHYCNLKMSGCLFRKVTCAPTPWYRTPHQLLHPATTRVPYPLTQLCLRLSIFYWIYISSILYAAPYVFKLRLDERFLEHFYASWVLKSIATTVVLLILYIILFCRMFFSLAVERNELEITKRGDITIKLTNMVSKIKQFCDHRQVQRSHW